MSNNREYTLCQSINQLKIRRSMQILDHHQIKQKINRIAIQILENNIDEKEIILAGINNNGLGFAKLIFKILSKRAEIPVRLGQIKINPAKPLQDDISIDIDTNDLKNKVVIIVDDVVNTGRTIFYAFKPLMEIIPSKIEVAVLVDRTHKSFPIKPDYIGISLATTAKENIDVKILKVKEAKVVLS